MSARLESCPTLGEGRCVSASPPRRLRPGPSVGAGDRERGAAEVLGLVIVAPAAIGLALVVLFLSRQVDSRATAQSAAEAAAQAAAQERSPAAAVVAAESVGRAMLIDDSTCASPSVAVDVSAFADPTAPLVSVTVSCTTSIAGLEVTGATPDTTTYTAFATLDPFRATNS